MDDWDARMRRSLRVSVLPNLLAWGTFITLGSVAGLPGTAAFGGFVAVLAVATLLAGPVYERWRHITPPPAPKLTRRGIAVRLALLALFPVTFLVFIILMRWGVGEPANMTLALFAAIAIETVALALYARRDTWR